MLSGRESLARRILRNTAFNVVGRVWLIGTNLLLTPIFLSYLGQDRFAVWVLFWSVLQYFLLFDLGIGAALIKHFAEFSARGESDAINRAVTSAVGIYLGLGIFVIALCWPLIAWAVPLLSVPVEIIPETVQAFQGGLLILLLLNLVSVFDGLLKGLQRMDLTNVVLIVVSIPNVLGAYLVLREGGGLVGLTWMVGAVYVLQLVLLILCARLVFPALRLRRRYVGLETVRLLFGYGARFQVPRVAELISYQADKILLGIFTPIRYVAFYDLGAKVSSLLHDLPYVLVSAVFPAASDLAGRGNREQLWLMYERGTKYLWLVTVPTLFGIWLTGHLILQVWLGHVSADVHRAVLLLSLGYWAAISVSMAVTVGAGLGWVTPLMQAGLLQGGLNIVLSLALILAFGYVGALIATLTALLVGNVYILVRFCREFDRSLNDHLRLLRRIVGLNLMPSLAAIVYLLWAGQWAGEGRGPACVILLGCILLYATLYLIAIRWSGVLDHVDQTLLVDHVPVLRSLVRNPA